MGNALAPSRHQIVRKFTRNWLRYKKRNLLKSALSAYDKRLIQKLL